MVYVILNKTTHVRSFPYVEFTLVDLRKNETQNDIRNNNPNLTHKLIVHG